MCTGTPRSSSSVPIRAPRTIIIDDDLIALLLSVKDRHVRLKAGVPDNAAVDLSLIRLPENALMFPSPPALANGDFEAPRHGVTISRDFACAAARLGFPGLRFHDLRLLRSVFSPLNRSPCLRVDSIERSTLCVLFCTSRSLQRKARTSFRLWVMPPYH